METERLIIRHGNEKDVQEMLPFRNSDYVLKYNAMIKADETSLMKEISSQYIMEKKADHHVIGFIGVEDDTLRYGVHSKCISYYMNEEETHHGYMQEALQAVISDLFRKETEVVVARVFKGNEASMKLLERLGFVHEGTLRKAVMGYGNILYDDALYSILKEEWESDKLF